MISEIFVDQDGVLSDFKKRYVQLFKANPEEDYNSKNKERKKLHHKRFDEFIKKEQFARLDPMPDFSEGIEYLKKIHKDYKIPICILTSVAREEYFNSLGNQKKFWLKHHNVPFFPVLVPGKRFKCLYSKPNRLLIDDTHSNINDWIRHGGIGIYHKNWKETINEINKLI